MSHDHHHDPHAIHAAPTNPIWRYVFSTDHKIIGVQFIVASLIFLGVGGLLALGVRYELAWPQQNVPHAIVLPGTMTNVAPESNIARWPVGGEVQLLTAVSDSQTPLPAGTRARIVGFPDGLAVTLPAGTLIRTESVGSYALTEPRDAVLPEPSQAMGDYDYTRQPPRIRVAAGTSVLMVKPAGTGGTGQAEAAGEAQSVPVTITGYQVWIATGDQPSLRQHLGQVTLPIRAADTLIALDGEQEIRTPHDDCLLVMPSPRVLRGHTAVRLARFED